MTLTPQETKEADCLLAMWQKAKQRESDFAKFANDTGELALSCYVKGGQAAPIELQAVANVLNQMEAEVAKFIADNRSSDVKFERHGLYISCDKQTADRMYAKLSQMDQHMLQILDRNKDISLAMPVLIALWQAHQPFLVDGLVDFLRRLSAKTKNLPEIWREAQRTIRKSLVDQIREFKDLRNLAYRAISTWVGQSLDRQTYMEDKGVILPVRIESSVLAKSPAQPINVNGAVSRRRQKQQAVAQLSLASQPSPSLNSQDESWKVVCVNEYGKELDSLIFKLSDDGTQLVETLDLCYGWPMGAGVTKRALAKLLRAKPTERNFVPWIPFGGISWYRLRVSKKYRILAHIKDDSQSVILMAGHKIKLVSAIGKRKDES
jgi:hypothetical protein